MEDIYKDIRPYTDAEVAEALPKLAQSKLIAAAGRALYADKPKDYLPQLVASCRSTEEFQAKVISEVLLRDLEMTHSSLSYSGLEWFKQSDGSIGNFVLVSTHRDIVLDPALVQLALYLNNIPTTEIAAGDNLLDNEEIAVAMRANRMIKVVRSDNPRIVYDTSRQLSAYIRDKVTKGGRSVWIAQRGGRTKNGRDCTEQGLLKMLDMSGTGSFYENFSQLKLMPVTISYEYETCGALKALELFTKEQQGFYRKHPGEDINSMVQGFIQRKGHVHVDFAQPLTAEELLRADSGQRNEKFRILANILDSRLSKSYRLWPANYAAADILRGGDEFLEEGYYTLADKESLIHRLRKESDGMPDEIYTRMLQLYAAHIV